MRAYLSHLNPTSQSNIDMSLLAIVALLVSVGLVLVASSSVEFASERYADPVYILRKQMIFLSMGVCIGTLVLFIPTDLWQKYSVPFLALGIFLLIAVLIPGIGKMVNGSRRWMSLGPFSMQASEMAKLCLIVFFAGYLNRRNEYVRSKWSAFFVMTGVVGSVVFLLLLEPDFGSSVVLCLTLGAMMFVAGVPLLRFLMLAFLGMISLAMIAVLSPYRWERLITFMDPWSRKFDSGYQLVQSLIAFGRGEFFGVGLGNSVQKSLFLPEAHTDFVFSIYVEEFGFVGALLLIAIVIALVAKIALIAVESFKQEKLFGGFICVGVGVMLAIQAFINMGVASGLLPTKGLTFPFVSYGGSSLLITCILVALVFRVNWELSRDQ